MSVTHFYTQKIPYFGNHGAIVVGKGGSTAKALKAEFNLSMLRAFRDDDGSQYFIIKGIDERGINHAAIRVQGLIISSMARKEQSQIEALDSERCAHQETREQLQVFEQHVLHEDCGGPVIQRRGFGTQATKKVFKPKKQIN